MRAILTFVMGMILGITLKGAVAVDQVFEGG